MGKFLTGLLLGGVIILAVTLIIIWSAPYLAVGVAVWLLWKLAVGSRKQESSSGNDDEDIIDVTARDATPPHPSRSLVGPGLYEQVKAAADTIPKGSI
jgi:hypothetical protein